MKLVELWKSAGSCTAFCIGLGHSFFSYGVTEVDNTILPLLKEMIQNSTAMSLHTLSPRVLPSYAILYWFSLKVIKVSYLHVILLVVH